MRRIASLVLRALACTALALSTALLLLTAVLMVPPAALALHASSVAMWVTGLFPDALCYWGVLSSPFGGVFRTDFLLVSFLLFLVAKLLRYVERRLK